jgi:hypothetical protein
MNLDHLNKHAYGGSGTQMAARCRKYMKMAVFVAHELAVVHYKVHQRTTKPNS